MTNRISHFWDMTSGSWIKKDTITATYHNASTLNEYQERAWNSLKLDWTDTTYFQRRDKNDNSIKFISRSWNYSTNEFNSGGSISLYSYDENENIIQILFLFWDNITSFWLNHSRSLNTYDGNEMKKLKQNWDSEISSWVNSIQTFYTYDDKGNMSQHISQNWDSGTSSWVNSSQVLFVYETNGNLTDVLNQTWDEGTSSWVNYFQFLHAYDENGNLTKFLSQTWNNEISLWVNSSQDLYTYDNYGNRTLVLWQTWDSETSIWIDKIQSLYSYDSYGNKTQYFKQFWSNSTDSWNNSSKEEYYWSEFETTSITDIHNSKINIYPNPANEKIAITGGVLLKKANIEIYSLSGKLVKSVFLDADAIDISSLQNGVYFIKFNNNNINFVKKFIKN